MAKYQVDDIRNIVFCGHGSAGKTTLVDALLNRPARSSGRPASMTARASATSTTKRRHHKYTIEATVTHFDHAGKHFHVIDTPGYPDFIGQTIGAMRGVDTAAIVINAQAGIEVNTRRVFAEAGKAGLGRMIVINKMDSENVDFPALLDEHPGAVRQGLRAAERAGRARGSDFQGVVSTLKRAGRHRRRPGRSGRDQRAADRVDHRGRRSR